MLRVVLENIQNNIQYWVGRNTPIDYFNSGIIFILVLFGFQFALKLFTREINLIKRSGFNNVLKMNLDDIGLPLYFVFALYFATINLILPGNLKENIYKLTLLVGGYYASKIIYEWVILLISKWIQRNQKDTEKFDPSALGFINTLVRIFVWILAAILILPQFGIRVTALVTSLGISGIAIAFSLQNILADIFASISIYFDKPFQVGDFISVGTDSGKVERIGLKSTRIQTLQGEELVVSNKELSQTRIRNFKKMETRRVDFTINILANTDTNKLKNLPTEFKKIVERQPSTKFDRAHLKEITITHLIYEIVYIILDKDHNIYMNIHQEINLDILEYLEKEQIKMNV